MVKKTTIKLLIATLFTTLVPAVLVAQDAKVSDFYTLDNIDIPEGQVIEVGSIEWMPDGRLAVGTRRGEIWMVHNSLRDVGDIEWNRYAHGMHQLLGLSYNTKDKYLYATQRGEITKVNDRNNDGEADEFRAFCNGWGVSGNYHEYAFGSKFDKDGNMYLVLCLSGSVRSADKNTPFRGWAMRITPDGKAEPMCGGIRSPGGIGFDAKGHVFYADNQGPWNGTSSIKHLKPGSFQGNPTGNLWYKRAPKMTKPVNHKSGSRIVKAAAAMKEYVPPAAQLTHGVLGNSTSGMVADMTGGKFGPFAGQLFVYDQSHSNIVRLHIEEVKGVLQSAAFMFMEAKEGFGSGNLVGVFAADGSMFVGGTNRGWGSRGKEAGAVDRIRWTGKVPFEPYTMSARPDGFELSFTKSIDKTTAADVAGYSMRAHTYIYQSRYGSPVVDKREPKITGVEVVDDKTIHVTVDALIRGHIHTLKMDGLRSKDGEKLLHNTGYYTLNEIPGQDPQKLSGIVADDSDTNKKGRWIIGKALPHFVASHYSYSRDPAASMTFTTKLPKPGKYEVRFAYTHHENRATNTPITVKSAAGDIRIAVNQQKPGEHNNIFHSLGTYSFANSATVVVTVKGANGLVCADALQFLPVN